MSERIVVGVDGSEGAWPALEWAVAEAQQRGAAVELVHVWAYPVVGLGETALALGAVAEAAENAAVALLDSAKELAHRAGGVTVTGTLVQGDAGHALVAAAEGAALLVVGSRGRGPLRSMLLGSVSGYVVQHATCPVVVVPETGRRAG